MKKDYFFYISIGLLGITAFALILWINPYGPGVNPDSIVYINGAKSILSGKGFSYPGGGPITHFPPMYSFFLAVIGFGGINILQTARFFNAVLFGINAGLIAWAVYLATRRNFLVAISAALFFLSSVPFWELHSMAWSEPLFIAFSLGCLILLSMYMVRPTLSLLIVSSLCLGFALLTRYIGIAFILAASLIVLVGRSDQNLSQRLRNTLIWVMLACAPLGILLTGNLMIAGSATDRSLVSHSMSVLRYFKRMLPNWFDFIPPISLPAGASLRLWGLLAVCVIVLLVILFRRRLKEINWRSLDWRSMEMMLTISCLLFFASYLLFLYMSISFFDASTTTEDRLLSPMFALFIVGAFSALWAISQKLKKPLISWCFILLIALSLSMKTAETIGYTADIQKNGLGYTSPQWQNSQTVAFARSLDEDTIIYSNGADVLGFLGVKSSVSIPKIFFATTTIVNLRYKEEIQAMCNELNQKNAVIVYLNRIDRKYLPTQKKIESRCYMPVLKHFDDGTVYDKK